MAQDICVLCGASAYEQKYYFNQDFDSLPDSVKKELQIMCVLFTEDVGGILTLEYDEEGHLQFRTEALEADGRYDDIGSSRLYAYQSQTFIDSSGDGKLSIVDATCLQIYLAEFASGYGKTGETVYL